MNPSTITARPYLYNQQQRQPPQPAQEMASQPDDPSQSQSQSQPYHDQSQSSQDYYAYYQRQYPYYYNQDFSNTYQQQQQHSQEPTSIHPPGVAIVSATAPMAGSDPTQMQYHPNAYYYPEGVVEHQQLQGSYSDFASQGFQGQQWGMDTNAPPVYGGPGFVRPSQQSSYRGRGRRGGKKGVERSHFAPPNGQAHTLPVWPPPQLAWCEICRADCNTIQILEQHRNGKKHKKNLQRLAELQNLNNVIAETRNVVTPQKPTFQLRPTAMQPEKGSLSEEKQAAPHNDPSEAVTGTNTFEIGTQQSMVKTLAGPVEEKEQGLRISDSSTQGRRFKRSVRGGRGAHKRMRINELSRQPVEPPKPKVVIPLVCELCNVKCESQVVFDTHLAGKKHISKLKRFPGYQAIVGAAIQALQPPNPRASSPLFKFRVNQQDLLPAEGIFTHSLPYVVPDVNAPSGGPTVEPKPAPMLYRESQNQPDSSCHGVQAISGTETLNVRQEENGQQLSVLIQSEAPSLAKPAPTLYLESQNEPDAVCHVVQAISETKTLDVRQEENGQQQSVLIESETPSLATVGLKIDQGPALEPVPTPALYLERPSQPDSMSHGVEAISETETPDVAKGENGQPKTALVESETPLAATVGLKIIEGSLGFGGKATPFENSSIDAGQTLDEATSSSEA